MVRVSLQGVSSGSDVGCDGKRMSEQAGFDYHMVKPVDPRTLMKYLAGLDVLKSRANKTS